MESFIEGYTLGDSDISVNDRNELGIMLDKRDGDKRGSSLGIPLGVIGEVLLNI